MRTTTLVLAVLLAACTSREPEARVSFPVENCRTVATEETREVQRQVGCAMWSNGSQLNAYGKPLTCLSPRYRSEQETRHVVTCSMEIWR
jgi:hypothetical protein